MHFEKYVSDGGSGLQTCLLPAFGVLDGSKVLACTEDLADMFGALSAGEVMGREIATLVAVPARAEFFAALSSHPGPHRSVALRPDGSTFPIEVVAFGVRFLGRVARLVTVRDLSPVAIVVDDEHPVGELTAGFLRTFGYRPVVYTSARRATAEWIPEAASVVVTDLAMPEVGGAELVQELRQSDPSLPVIFMSGGAEQPLPLDEATVFLKKPFRIHDLRDALAKLPERAKAILE